MYLSEFGEIIPSNYEQKIVRHFHFRLRASLGIFSVMFVLIVLKFILPEGPNYTKGFAPIWVTIFASLLGSIVVMLEKRWLRNQFSQKGFVKIIAWGSCILLIWSSAGIVFDFLRAAAVMGIPGLPPVVDWLGFVFRTVSLIAAILIATATITFQRISRGACVLCGKGPQFTMRSKKWYGYAAFVLSFPYPLLKIYWSLGGPLWGGNSFAHNSAYGEIIVFGISALLSLALVQKWGRVFPNWFPIFSGKRVPRWLLITGGWIAASMTTTLGILAIFGSILQALGLEEGPVGTGGNPWIVSFVYVNWLLLGISMGAATWFYQQSSRGKCLECKR